MPSGDPHVQSETNSEMSETPTLLGQIADSIAAKKIPRIWLAACRVAIQNHSWQPILWIRFILYRIDLATHTVRRLSAEDGGGQPISFHFG